MLTARQKFKKEKLSDYWSWIKAVWVNARGNPLTFDNRHYLKLVYQDQFRNIVYTKSAQMGLSERGISESIWVADQLDKVVLYTFPAQIQLQDFVQARVNPVISYSDYLKAKTENVDEKIHKLGLKKIGKGFIYFRGSTNEKQIITVDADMVVLDERDRFSQDSIPFIDKRMLGSELKWRREISTPTLPDMGIHKAYIDSDQRVWEIECKQCGLWQELDLFKNIDFDKNLCICKKCKKEMNRYADGRWNALKPERSEETHGYKINGLYNPMVTTEQIVKKYKKANINGFSELQQFFNQDIGVPYEIKGQSLQLSDIEKCRRDYISPYKVKLNTFAGCDVGNTKHHMIVVQKRGKSLLRVVWAGTLNNFFGPQDSVESVMETYGVQRLVIDKKPQTTMVAKLIAKYGKRVYACNYPNSNFSVQNYFAWDDVKRELDVDRTISLDYLISDIQNERIELPGNINSVESFYDQLRSSVRITEKNKRTGIETARWVEKKADHYLHALNYARMAQIGIKGSQALLDYYREPEEGLTPNFIDWVRINGMRMQ